MRHCEDILHASIWRQLQHLLPETCLSWSVENRGNGEREGKRRKSRGCIPGVPDLHFLHDGRLLCVELKTKSGRLNEAQAALHERIRQCGGAVSVCRSLEDVVAFLTENGVKMKGSIV
ncbi:VRR-NUC domain-containing protein [Bombella apis]|uniref:VRR-NUC domain-containing protein n=1 Tax=Bombella apis TaxID=1785988 RepID=UPI0012B6C683|nr:VRR-NUC domain-containing protein [Bombella apis]MPV99836.1 hypothetical protein [Bombella apis]MUH03162.1 hypothetical protein [Bombella sp. ESL0387]